MEKHEDKVDPAAYFVDGVDIDLDALPLHARRRHRPHRRAGVLPLAESAHPHDLDRQHPPPARLRRHRPPRPRRRPSRVRPGDGPGAQPARPTTASPATTSATSSMPSATGRPRSDRRPAFRRLVFGYGIRYICSQRSYRLHGGTRMAGALEGRVALVTGASKNIGKGIALEIAASGAVTYLTARIDRGPARPAGEPEPHRRRNRSARWHRHRVGLRPHRRRGGRGRLRPHPRRSRPTRPPGQRGLARFLRDGGGRVLGHPVPATSRTA